MIAVLIQNSLSDFIDAESKKEFALNSDFFSMKYCFVRKYKLYDELYAWVDWYSLFEKRPLYLAIFREGYWHKISGDLPNSFKFTVWKTVPKHISKDTMLEVIPYDERMWKDDTYFYDVCDRIQEISFKSINGITAKLNGNMDELNLRILE